MTLGVPGYTLAVEPPTYERVGEMGQELLSLAYLAERDRTLQRCQSTLDPVMERFQERDGWVPRAGSDILRDDELCGRHELSYAATTALMTAIDYQYHLISALRDQPWTPRGHYPYFRGIIECACLVLWLLGPSDRPTRVTRQLNLARKDLFDEMAVADGLDIKVFKRHRELDAEFRKLARKAHLADFRFETVRSSEIVKWVAGSDERWKHLQVQWQMASACVHGRHWTYRLMHQDDPIKDREYGTRSLFTPKVRHVLGALTVADDLITAAIDLYDGHAGLKTKRVRSRRRAVATRTAMAGLRRWIHGELILHGFSV